MEIKDYVIYHSGGNLYWKDKEFRYLGCNYSYAQSVNLDSPDDIIGKTDHDLFYEALGAENIQKLLDVDRKVIYDDEDITCEETGIDAEGKIAYFLTKKIPLKDPNGNIIGLVGTSIDITDRKITEMALHESNMKAIMLSENMSKSKADFIAALNNDLRTQMNVISMSLDCIERFGIKDDHKPFYNGIHEAIEEMTPILDYAENYAKIDLNVDKAPLNYFNPLPYLNSNIESIYYKITSSQSDISINIENYIFNDIYSTQVDFDKVIKILLSYIAGICEKSHCIVELDSLKHQDDGRLLINFMVDNSLVKSNYIKDNLHMNKEKPNHISMSLIYCAKLIEEMGGLIDVYDQDNSIVISVTLQGVKKLRPNKSQYKNAFSVLIIDENLSRAVAYKSQISALNPSLLIIEKQNTLESSIEKIRKNKFIIIDGSLYSNYSIIIKSLIDSHKNNFFIILSAENIFTSENKIHGDNVVILDKFIRHDALEKSILEVNQKLKRVRNKLLIVEDNKLLRQMLKMNFDAIDYDTELVASGEEGVELVKNNDYYAVFIDIGLPGISGLDAAKIIKSIKPNQKLIALTGLTLSVDINNLWESGFFIEVLKKPAHTSTLENVLNNIHFKNCNIIEF